jgi:hypothetical protein
MNIRRESEAALRRARRETLGAIRRGEASRRAAARNSAALWEALLAYWVYRRYKEEGHLPSVGEVVKTGCLFQVAFILAGLLLLAIGLGGLALLDMVMGK